MTFKTREKFILRHSKLKNIFLSEVFCEDLTGSICVCVCARVCVYVCICVCVLNLK